MAAKDFDHIIRTAAAALAAGTAGDSRVVARWTASRDLWLTPEVVYELAHDRLILPPEADGRDVLARMDQFRATAIELSGRQPTPDEIRQAAGLLAGVLAAVAEHFTEPEGEALVRALWAVPVPDFVLALDYDLDNDWTGAPAVRAWVVIRDDADPESDEFQDFADGFRDRAWQALAKLGSGRIPYVRFRPESEAKAALAGGAA
ncbi:MAG: hypothetical protein K2X82_30990 [Gemmataceae bacterium]|nr:hypothetical protein [Gemmataceae bacterium]